MRKFWIAALGFACLAAVDAKADDQPFITVHTTDIESQYEKEIEQTFLWSTQKPDQVFNGFLSRTEFEYGVTDDFQVSGRFNYEWERGDPHPSGSAEEFHAVSVSGEAIYRFLNPYFDPVGLAVYFEPTFGDNVRELEAKLLLQKNFFYDTLRLAANLNFENAWERENGLWSKGSAVEFFAGAAYNVTSAFSVGVEFNNENDFNGLLGGAHPAANAYYFGPTISYVGLPFTVVLGAQFQLPWANDRTHTPGAIDNGYLAVAPRTRVGFRINMDLPY